MQTEHKYLFSDEYDEKVEKVNMRATELAALLAEHHRRQIEDGTVFRKEDLWFSKVTDLVLEFLSLEDHLANAGRPLGIMMEVEEIMEEHIIKTHLDEGTLPYDIALLSTKQFKDMKKETLK